MDRHQGTPDHALAGPWWARPAPEVAGVSPGIIESVRLNVKVDTSLIVASLYWHRETPDHALAGSWWACPSLEVAGVFPGIIESVRLNVKVSTSLIVASLYWHEVAGVSPGKVLD